MSSIERRLARLEKLLAAPPVSRDEFNDLMAEATLHTRDRMLLGTPPDTSAAAVRRDARIAEYLSGALGVRDWNQPGKEYAKLLAFGEQPR